MSRATGAAGLALIKSFEGCRLRAYKAAPTEKYYTIGWGHYGPDVGREQVISQAEADALLEQDVRKYEAAVSDAGCCPITDSLTQDQFDALVSFAYNCGAGRLETLCAGRTASEIAEKLALYNKAGGKVLAGLTRRREAERALFLTPDAATHTVTAPSGLRLRKEAGDGEVLDVMQKGAAVTVKEVWAKVEYRGMTGWCSMEWLAEA